MAETTQKTKVGEEPVKEPLVLQVLEKLSQLMAAAFGFVAALAWNDAIKSAIQTYLPAGTALRAQLVYATAVTVLAVLAGIWIASTTNRAKNRFDRLRARRLEKKGTRTKAD